MSCGKKRRHGFLHIVGTFLVIAGIIALLALVGIELFIRPTLKMLLDYKCRTAAERIISDAVFDRLNGENEIGDIISLTFDPNGNVAALTTDQRKINSLKALLNDAVNEGIDRLGGEVVGISAGTLTGISMLYGTGHTLNFRIEPKGSAETRLSTSFTNAGINQTIHSIMLEVDTELSPMMPGFTETVNVKYDILLSQSVIVGKVPDTYSYIVLDNENLSELANIDI